MLRWPGGKTRHLKHLLPLIPEHHCYCEAFAGGLALFLAKPRSRLEVVNDQNGTLVALYRNAQFHVEELICEVQWILNSRREFIDAVEQPGLTEIQRVARYLVRNHLSYGGLGRHFGWEGARASREFALEKLRALSQRLDRTIIEQLPYQEVIAHYDKRDAFFFLDPPYLDANPGVYAGWNEAQMREFAEVLAGIKGRWIVTVNGGELTREIFAGYEMRETRIDNKLASARVGKTTMPELIITPAKSRTPRRASAASERQPAEPSRGMRRSRSVTPQMVADR